MKLGVSKYWWGYQCNRCGNHEQQLLATFFDMYEQQEVVYCRACLTSTQANTYEVLQAQHIRKPIVGDFSFVMPFALTKKQQQALFHLRGWLWPGNTLMLQAVCGAGKTEIIASLIADALRQGKYVGWTIARKDVVIEITERLRCYFPQTDIIGLYQRSPDLAASGQLIVLTTARLYEFYRFFDILIVDENDAFPFSLDAGQQFAARQAIVQDGAIVHISATVFARKRKEYQYIHRLARRFHGYDLPAITFRRVRLITWLGQHRLDKRLAQQLDAWLHAGVPVFIFVSNKKLGRAFTVLLQEVFGSSNVAFVSSDIVDRTPILQAVREGTLSILVTTTILERGVTYKNLQVIVLDAEAALFDAQTLIQIAGRVGRNYEEPDGAIIFCYQTHITTAMRQAQKYHKQANEGSVPFL